MCLCKIAHLKGVHASISGIYPPLIFYLRQEFVLIGCSCKCDCVFLTSLWKKTNYLATSSLTSHNGRRTTHRVTADDRDSHGRRFRPFGKLPNAGRIGARVGTHHPQLPARNLRLQFQPDVSESRVRHEFRMRADWGKFRGFSEPVDSLPASPAYSEVSSPRFASRIFTYYTVSYIWKKYRYVRCFLKSNIVICKVRLCEVLCWAPGWMIYLLKSVCDVLRMDKSPTELIVRLCALNIRSRLQHLRTWKRYMRMVINKRNFDTWP